MLDRVHCSNVYRSRNYIIAGLAHVDVIVRMNGLPGTNNTSKHLNSTIRDHLIGIHVSGRAGTSLEDVENKVRIELTVRCFLSCVCYRISNLFVQQAQIHVCSRSGMFDQAEGSDKFPRETNTANGKVFDGSLSLCPV